jgi:hypothetical protein
MKTLQECKDEVARGIIAEIVDGGKPIYCKNWQQLLDDSEFTTKEMSELCDKVAELYAQTRWIPCSERLPEVKIDPNKDINDSTAVLGLLSNGEIYKMYLSHWYEDEPNSFNWRYSDCGELCDSVVMWTTLPPLPDSPNVKKIKYGNRNK